MTHGPQLLVMSTLREGPKMVLALQGDLDLSGADEFSTAVSTLLDDSPEAIELDAEGLDFIDSAGLHAVVRAQKAAARVGVRLAITHSSDAVDRVLAMTGLHDQLVTTPTT